MQDCTARHAIAAVRDRSAAQTGVDPERKVGEILGHYDALLTNSVAFH